MGRLINVGDFGYPLHRRPRRGTDAVQTDLYDAFWFFANREYPELADSFPVRLSIHAMYLEGGKYADPDTKAAGATRIEIRKFIERQMDNDVVWTKESLTHVRVMPPHGPQKKRHSHEIAHAYYHFHFETEADAIFFKTMFGEIVREPTQHHPRHPPQEGYDDFFGRTAHMDARALTGNASVW
jgi:hypothetical protein